VLQHASADIDAVATMQRAGAMEGMGLQWDELKRVKLFALVHEIVSPTQPHAHRQGERRGDRQTDRHRHTERQKEIRKL